jgi:hypothetical protein
LNVIESVYDIDHLYLYLCLDHDDRDSLSRDLDHRVFDLALDRRGIARALDLDRDSLF